MNAIVIEHVKVSELPEAWRNKLAAENEAHVTVRIEQEPALHGGPAGDVQATPAQELAAIRELLSQGQLKDARVLIERARKQFPENEELHALHKITAPRRAARSPVTHPPRDREVRWLAEHRHDYKGRWVALNGRELLAVAETMKQLLSALSALEVQGSPLIHKVE